MSKNNSANSYTKRKKNNKNKQKKNKTKKTKKKQKKNKNKNKIQKHKNKKTQKTKKQCHHLKLHRQDRGTEINDFRMANKFNNFQLFQIRAQFLAYFFTTLYEWDEATGCANTSSLSFTCTRHISISI